MFYDLVLIAATTLLRGTSANTFVFLSPFADPVDMVLIASLIVLDGVTIFGAAGVAMIRFLGGGTQSVLVLIIGLGLWVSLPLLISIRWLRRQDL